CRRIRWGVNLSSSKGRKRRTDAPTEDLMQGLQDGSGWWKGGGVCVKFASCGTKLWIQASHKSLVPWLEGGSSHPRDRRGWCSTKGVVQVGPSRLKTLKKLLITHHFGHLNDNSRKSIGDAGLGISGHGGQTYVGRPLVVNLLQQKLKENLDKEKGEGGAHPVERQTVGLLIR
ncbi:hypothetical protein E2320_022088, partial [Naja naja]